MTNTIYSSVQKFRETLKILAACSIFENIDVSDRIVEKIGVVLLIPHAMMTTVMSDQLASKFTVGV